jgi:crotonobetainyl-CoA:carnitine CoA-transferase CaiB-like acyl-CoA transferase
LVSIVKAERPLGGLRVVDMTSSIAGPYCTLMLGALGADVVKIERLEQGDDTRLWGPPFWHGEGTAFLAVNANKRSISLDVRRDEGREVVLRLAESADVFVQNLRPQLVDELGLGFESVRARNAAIIYCSIGSFGSVGPLRSEPGYDPLMQAAGGLMSITGEVGGAPVRSGVSVIDQGTALWAIIGILGALRLRDSDGVGRHVETSLYETALNWLPVHLAGFLATGVLPRPMGTGLAFLVPYGVFEAMDGPIMIAAPNDRFFQRLCRALGDEGLALDARFRTNASRVKNREELEPLLADHIQRFSRAHWIACLRDAGVPAAPVHDLSEVVDNEQTQALGILQPIEHPRISELQLIASPISLDHQRIDHARRPPDLGEHSQEILQEIGYSDQEIHELSTSGVVQTSRRRLPPDPG